MTNKNKLVLPVYLDFKTLLDFMASIEGGFSYAETIIKRASSKSETSLEAGGSFGIDTILNFFKIDFEGKAEKSNNSQLLSETQTQRYHTFGSLLTKLLNYLEENKILKRPNDDQFWEIVKPSDIIEIRGKFNPCSFSENFKVLSRMIDFLMNIINLDFSQQPPNSHKKPDDRQKKNKEKVPKNVKNVSKFIQELLKNVEDENYQTYIVNLALPENHKMVLRLFKEYIRDRSGTELPNGEFLVLGKITQKINSGDGFDLMKGTALECLNKEMLDNFIGSFKQLPEYGFKITNLQTTVEPPLLIVIPIAIYI